MAEDADSFGENPFRNLDPGKFRSANEDDADRDLFLRALKRLPRREPKAAGGFLLMEQCALPDLRVKKKKAPPAEPEPKKVEEDEFLLAVRNARPIGGGGRRVPKRPEQRAPQGEREDTLADFMAGKLEFAVSSTGEYLEGHVAGMDELVLNRLREGQFSPEAHLDLHGLNATQAFEALREFIHGAWLRDLRTVLIVTGRGRNSPYGQGILRQKLQVWLTREPFKRVIRAFCTAVPHDGGPGSIYVLLRRFRKKGRIQWDRLFIDSDSY